MLIVTKTPSLLVDGNVDVLYGVFHTRQAWQPVMSMKHSTLGRWTVQSVHWKKKEKNLLAQLAAEPEIHRFEHRTSFCDEYLTGQELRCSGFCDY